LGGGFGASISGELAVALSVFLPPTIAMGATFTHIAQGARDRTGLGVALGLGALYTRGAKKRVARLMGRIRGTIEGMGGWFPVAEGDENRSGGEDDLSGTSMEAAKNTHGLEALQDRRAAMGTRVTLRRLTYALVVGASLVSILPTALQFFPSEYPLPWIIVGGLGWIFFRTVRRLLRGIREQRELDAEIQARLEPTQGPAGDLTSRVESS
jgi:hypothetical protein